MADSFSELRTAGGSNKPWVVGGVLAIVIALAGIAIAAGYRIANPRPGLLLNDGSVPGPYTGTMHPGVENRGTADRGGGSWDGVAVLGQGGGTLTDTETGCTVFIAADGRSVPLNSQCDGAFATGTWAVGKSPEDAGEEGGSDDRDDSEDSEDSDGTDDADRVLLRYSEDGTTVVQGVFTAGAPDSLGS